MSAFSRTIKNIFGGVSQAPPVQRDPSQFTDLINMTQLFGNRLARRPATEHVAVVSGGNFVYEFGDYTLTFTSAGAVQCFHRKTGVAQTVVNNVTWGYFGTGLGLKAITLGETAYVLNTSVVAAKSAALAPSAPFVAHVTVNAGDYETQYVINLDGTAYSTTTPAATAAGAKGNIQTTVIADNLRAAIVAGGLFTVNRYGATLAIKRTTSSDFTVTAVSGLGDGGITAIKDIAKTAADLPQFADALTVVKIVGSDGTKLDDYYVHYVNSAWSECTAPAQANVLDGHTLPVQITRNPSTGVFTVDQVNWDIRAAGDDTQNPFPSFIGHAISDLFVYEGRMGFVSGSRVTLSEAGKLTNFFRTSASQILSSDPIDVDGAISGVTNFAHALHWRGAVYLFTERAQFVLQGGREGLTAETISITQASAYTCDTTVRPVVCGQRIFFLSQSGDYPHVMDYHAKPYIEEPEAVDISTDIPSYISGTPILLLADESLGVLFLVTAGGIYVYTFRDTNEGRVQSSWSQWAMNGALIRGMSLVDNVLRMVMFYDASGGLSCLEQLRLTDESWVHLDRRVNSLTPGASAVFAGGVTTFTLPYNVMMDATEGNLFAYVPETGEVAFLTRTALNAGTAPLSVAGKDWYVGVSYMSLVEFSTLYDRNQNGGNDDRGRLQLRFVTLNVDKTTDFDVYVDHTGRAQAAYNFHQIDAFAGPFTFPVMGRNTDIHILLSTIMPGPFSLTSYSWEGMLHARSPRR